MSKVMINMKMPKSCLGCKFKNWTWDCGGWKNYDCFITGRTVNTYCKNSKAPKNKRHPECPLQEVKE